MQNLKETEYYSLLEKIFSRKWIDFFEENNLIHDLAVIMYRIDSLVESSRLILPYKGMIFRVFQETDLDDIKVVILGQDPYPGIYKNIPSANGRAFSTENGYTNPSLKNMFKELKDDLGIQYSDNSLQLWVDQGVFLLNCALTVEHQNPGSHLNMWKDFTSKLIHALSNYNKDIVWVLLGSKSKEWAYLINSPNIVEASHPSPLARGKFFGSKIFSKINSKLKNKIKWGN